MDQKKHVYDFKVNSDTIAAKVFGSNATFISLIQFKLNQGQTDYIIVIQIQINIITLGKLSTEVDIKNLIQLLGLNLTSWSEDSFSIRMNVLFMYLHNLQASNILCFMLIGLCGVYLSNGKQSGWQRDNSTRYMTFITATQKKILQFRKNI